MDNYRDGPDPKINSPFIRIEGAEKINWSLQY